MAIGSDGTGWIQFEDYELARTIGIVALALILFEGGLTSGLVEIRPVLGTAVSLALIATPITAAISGVAAWLLFDDFDLKEGLLVGAVLASTDGAAIFALLRNSTLRRRLARTLEGESGLNDPVAVLLVLALIEFIKRPELRPRRRHCCCSCGSSGSGSRSACSSAGSGVQAFQRAQLATAGLYPVASLAIAALAFGGADTLHGSGFLAVYLAGLALGSASIPAQQTIAAFHQGLAWVAQVGMFLTLGLLVFPHQLDDIAVEGTVLALVAAAVARPLAVFPATAFAHFGKRERLVLGWAGLRGAVPVVLATFPVIAEVPGSRELFNIVFFAVLVSTVLQGTTFEPLAARLGHDDQRARAAAAARRGRHDPAPRRGDPRVPDRRRRRDRRPPRARPRPAARRGGQRDRARRPGDPAARHHAPARRRPPPRADPPGERARALRDPRPLALRPDRPPAAPARRARWAARRCSRPAPGASRTATRRTRSRSAAAA